MTADTFKKTIEETLTSKGRVTITYKNWKGEISDRLIMPERIYYGKCEPWHKEEQWLLQAWDVEKKAYRTFAMCEISKWINTG